MALSELLVKVGADIAGFTSAMDSVASKLDHVGDNIVGFGEQFTHGLEGLGEGALELAGELGIAFGAVEIMKESLASFATEQKATIALGAIMGSAEGATAAIEKLKDMAISQGLDLPSLITAQQRLLAAGFAIDQVTQALQAAANAAAATNSSVDATSEAIRRISESGTLSSRTLVSLNLTMGEVAEAMGKTEESAKAAFKSLDASDRLQVLIDSLHKLDGDSEAVAQSLSGQWQSLKTSIDVNLLVPLGEFISPIAETAISALQNLAAASGPAKDGFASLGASIASLSNSASFWKEQSIAIGTAIGFVGDTLSTVITAVHAFVLQLSDAAQIIANPLNRAAWKQYSDDVAATGTAFSKSMSDFQTTATDGDLAAAKLQAQLTGLTEAYDPLCDATVKASHAAYDFTATQADLTKAFEAAKVSYAGVIEQFKGGKASADDVNAAYATMKAAAEAAGKLVQDLGTATAALGVALQAIGLKPVADQIGGLENAMTVIRQAFDDGTISTEQYDAAVKKFVTSMDSLQAKFQATTGPIDIFSRDAADKLNDALGPAMEEMFLKAGDAIEQVGIRAGISQTGIFSMDSAMKTLGQQTLPDAQNRIRDLQNTLDGLNAAIGVDVPLAAQKAADALIAIDRAQQQISADRLDQARLGIPDLDTLATKLQVANDAYKRLSSDGVLTATQAMLGQIQIDKDTIAQQVLMGNSTTDLRIKLDQEQASIDRVSTSLFGLYKNLQSILTTDLSNIFKDVIWDVSGLGDALAKMGKDIVNSVIDSITKIVFQPFIDVAAKAITDAVSWILQQIGITIATAGSTATSTAALGTNTTALYHLAASVDILNGTISGSATAGAAGDAGSAASSAGSSAGSGAGAVAGGALGWVTAISGAVTAVASVLQLFGVGQEGQKDRLDIIANNIAPFNKRDEVQSMPALLTLMNDFRAFSGTGFGGWFHDYLVGELDWKDGVTSLLGSIDAGIGKLMPVPTTGKLSANVASASPLGGATQVVFNIYDATDPNKVANAVAAYLGIAVPA